MSESSELKVLFSQGAQADLPESPEEGKLYFSMDTGNAFLGTENGGKVQIRSDLPVGVLSPDSTQVTCEVSIPSLPINFSVRIYGSRIPTTMNINNTGDIPVVKGESALTEDISFTSSRMIVYTLCQFGEDSWAWVVNESHDIPDAEEGKILGTDADGKKSWVDFNDAVPVIQETSGTTVLDSITKEGRYVYVAQNGLRCTLIVTNTGAVAVEGIPEGSYTVYQWLIKSTGHISEDLDNLGRGLVGAGIFVRSGYYIPGVYDPFTWDEANEGNFTKMDNCNLPNVGAWSDYSTHGIYLKPITGEDGSRTYEWELFEPIPVVDNEWLGNPSFPIKRYDPDTNAAGIKWMTPDEMKLARTDEGNDFTGDQTVSGDLTVSGSLYVNGDTYQTHTNQIYSKNDYIFLRDGAVSGLTNGQYAGFEAKKYDGTYDGRLVFDNTGTARVGDVGDEQPLATRSEASAIKDGTIAQWSVPEGGAPKLVSGLSIVRKTAAEYQNLVDTNAVDTNTLYLIIG